MQRVAQPRGPVSAFLLPPILAFSLATCAVGPDYSRPAAPVPTKFKELKALPGWKLATPRDALDRGDWWTIYRDNKLDRLMRQVEVSNQTVAAQAAAYENARAVIREAQAALFPTVTGNYSATRMRTGPNVQGGAGGGGVSGGSGAGAGGGGAGSGGGGAGGGNGGAIYTTTFVPQLSASWAADVWGKVRRQIESNTAAAQLSAADLANTKLSEQAMLATAYYNLRASDALYDLLGRTVSEYRRTLRIVQNQFNAGYSVTAGDVATAKAQVETTLASQLNVGVQRAQFEHAIAMLIGRPPAELTVGHDSLVGTIPKIPVTIPSTLLERRPDIAAAERMMQQENALIGVAEAAFYPTITLSGMIEWIGKNPLPFSAANEIWSLGAAASEPIFEGGLLSAQLDAARATYWESVANYRQTVLTAFQGVEDELAAIRYLQQALRVQEQAVKDARTAVDVFINQFQAGTVAFTTVVTAEIILLGDEETALTYRQDLFLASVLLIQNLGGSWDTTLLPTQKELQSSFSVLPQLPTQ
jgi:NodT family efflux transporter outer membrane factor (OMF) lipoprotein